MKPKTLLLIFGSATLVFVVMFTTLSFALAESERFRELRFKELLLVEVQK